MNVVHIPYKNLFYDYFDLGGLSVIMSFRGFPECLHIPKHYLGICYDRFLPNPFDVISRRS
jgi:hypothetical protein